MNNKFSYNRLFDNGIYTCSLDLNKKTLNKIFEQIYELENHPEKIYHSYSSRTFKIHNGFHSVNLLDKKYGILEKYEELKILVSRVQEIVFNYFKNEDIDFTETKGNLKITEIWINILRVGDYNIPHNHPNCDISGNFYLKVPTKKNIDTDGSLIFIKNTSHNYYLPTNVKKNESVSPVLNPTENLGVLFRSYMKHIVMPHFSDEDRIGIAFNSVFDFNYNYKDIYPIPYWLPIKYTYNIDLDDFDQKNNCFNIKFDNNLTLKYYLEDTIDKNYYRNKKIYFNYSKMKDLVKKMFSINVQDYFIMNKKDS